MQNRSELETAMTNFFCYLLKYYKSQNEVATILGVDKSYVSRLKSGQINVQLAQIYALYERGGKSFEAMLSDFSDFYKANKADQPENAASIN